MADSTVDALTAASALDGTEEYYTVQGGLDRKATGAQIKTLAAKVTVNAQTGTTYTVQSTDIGGLTTFSNASPVAVTLPQATGSFSTGSTLYFENKGAGTVTITPATSTIDGSATLALTQNQGVMLISDGTNYASVRGIGGASGLTIGTTTIASGTTSRFLYDNGAVVGEALIRYSAANLFLGDVDAASPVAQTLNVQSVVTGTSNTAGTDFTIAASKGTGTGVGGDIIFKTAPAGGSGSSQNALGTTLTIKNDGLYLAARYIYGSGSTSTSLDFVGGVTLRLSPRGTAVCQAESSLSNTYSQLALMGGARLAWASLPNDPSSADDVILVRNAAATLQMGSYDAAAPVAQTLTVQSVIAGTTDTAGTDWTLRNSLGTGTGASGNLVTKTGFSAKSTGTSQHTSVDRHIIVAKGKVLTSAAAFSMFDVALPTLTMCGGVIEATIVCTNGTDMQSFTQTVTYSAVNKGGVYTTSITPSTGDKSVSSGTLTTSWTIVSGTNKVTIKVTPTTSLTPSTNAFLLYYTVRNNSEQATTIL